MGEFTADWLALREALDAASRHVELTQRLVDWRMQFNRINIIDLGTGSGANVRFLAPRLGGEQDWRLVDNDPCLLANLTVRMRRWGEAIGLSVEPQGNALQITGNGFWNLQVQQLDLAAELGQLELQGGCLVTASALLDLVSEAWIDALVNRCHQAGAALLMTLTYNGVIQWEPTDRDDAAVCERVNRHQHTAKGFGPALGPDAADYFIKRLAKQGYRVYSGASDWQIDANHSELHGALIQGYAEAVQAQDTAAAPWVNAWLTRRRAALTLPASRLTVGHRDVLALAHCH